MKRKLFLILVLSSTIMFAQEKLRVFVEGDGIDFNYLRNNIDFIDFVNDPQLSEVHIMVNRQPTGGGGKYFTIDYHSKEFEKPGDYSLSCNAFSFDTQDVIRDKLTSTIKAGIVPFVNEKNGSSFLNITTSTNDKSIIGSAETTYDPWNNWVFKLGLNGGFRGEEQKKSFNYAVSLRAVKVTKEWKIINEYDYRRNESFIKTESDQGIETIHSLYIDQDADIRAVFSLTEKWSLGLFFEGSQNTYRNYKIAFELMPAIEYNLYPWNEADKRTFTFRYYVGPSYNKYYETTILGKNEEWLFAENIGIRLEQVETWGELGAEINVGHYFPKFDDYFFEAGVDLGFRITKGLFFTFGIQAESIHNQRYIAASELSDEAILLDIRKLPTTFEYSGRMGIQFQFGSIFNNIVNERL